MNSVAMVLCVCIIRYSCGEKLSGDNTRQHHGYSRASRGFGNKFGNTILGSWNWAVDKAKNAGTKFGSYLKLPALPQVSGQDVMAKMGGGLVSSIVHGAGDGLARGWGAVQTFKLPGWQYVMVFPNAVVSIVDKTKNTAWFMAAIPGKTVVAAQAFMLMTTLKVIDAALGPALRLLNLDCIKTNHLTLNVGEFLVDRMELKGCTVCGISSLYAGNNVTLIDDGQKYLVVVVPYAINDLLIRVRAVNIYDNSGVLVKNERMHVIITKTYVDATIKLKKGNFLSLLKIKLRVVKFEEFNPVIDVKDRNTRTDVQTIIDAVQESLTTAMMDTVNDMFEKIEEDVTQAIIGRWSEDTNSN